MRGPFILILLVGLVPLTIFALIVAGSGSGLVLWQPPAIWEIRFGTPNGFNGVTALSTGTTGLFAVGYVSDTNLINNSLFVSRYDLSGHQLWTQRFADSDRYPNIGAIAVGADGVYAAGVLNGSGFVRKYDFNGNQGWGSKFDGPWLSEPMSVSATSSMVFVGGVGSSPVNGAWSVLLREYDLQGKTVWTDTLGNSTGDIVGVYAGTNGVYVTGELLAPGQYNPFVREYAFNGSLLWNHILNPAPGFPCSCTMSGVSGDASGIVVAGSYDIPSLRGKAFIQKYDLKGNQLWMAQISSPDYTGFDSPGISANSFGIYLSSVTGHGATFVMKYDGNGNSIWSFQMKALRHPLSRSLPISVGENGVFVGGVLSKDNGDDAYVTEFSQSSSLILFGVNPPFSFVMVGSIAGAVAVTILFLRRRRARFGSKTMSHGSTSLRKARQPGV